MSDEDAIREAVEAWLRTGHAQTIVADAVHDAVTQWLRNEGGAVIRDAVFSAELAART